MSDRIYDELLKSLIKVEDGEEYIQNYLEFPSVDGQSIKMTFEQIKHFCEVMDGSSEFLNRYSPIEFAIISYELKDEFTDGYALTSYSLEFSAKKRTLEIFAQQEHPMTIPESSSYVEGAQVPPKLIRHTVENVSLYGNLSLVNCISRVAPEFSEIKGAYGGGFRFTYAERKYSLISTGE